MFLKQSGCTEQHGTVHVMSAAVHLALNGTLVIHIGFLKNGESIHICSKQDTFTGLMATKGNNYS